MATEQQIAGRYTLERRLGVGGMSTVQLAYDARLERQVAVKLLAEHLADDPSFVSRFRREALAAAKLVHPNIVQVFDFGLDERSARHYIVMEFVQGRSCAEILRDDGPMSVDAVVDVVTQACRGLDHAHRHGVVHRDVKPGNLMVSNEGVVKLADFGIAKAAEQSSITQVGSVLGTAAYLAPEQARGEEAGPQADLYALGVCTYQLMSARLPYEAASLTELAIKQQSEAPVPLDQMVPEVPHTLALAVEGALALDPVDRYEDAPEMASALLDGQRGIAPDLPGFDEQDPTSATAFMDRTQATQMAPSPRAPRQARRVADTGEYQPPARQRDRDRPQKKKKNRRWIPAVIILAVLLIGIGVLIYLATSSGGGVTLSPVDADQVPELVDQLEQLINDNTQ